MESTQLQGIVDIFCSLLGFESIKIILNKFSYFMKNVKLYIEIIKKNKEGKLNLYINFSKTMKNKKN